MAVMVMSGVQLLACECGTDSVDVSIDTVGVCAQLCDSSSLCVAKSENKENAISFNLQKEYAPAYTINQDLTYVGIPLFFAGLFGRTEKSRIHRIHNDFVEKFHSPVDNYTQYAPFVLSSALQVAGVKGRSKLLRYSVSSALSFGLMAAFVNSIKYSAKELRPDKSTRNSFPSGHTATAFVAATILHKEYGLTRSPWYSVAGYGLATATGIMRMLNNRHWVSDVLSGAGIGIMSTELAYVVSDLIFKAKGINKSEMGNLINLKENPSFFSIHMGGSFGGHNLTMPNSFSKYIAEEKLVLKFGTASVVGIEGAYFLNPYIGIGMNMKTSSRHVKNVDGRLAHKMNSKIDMTDITIIVERNNLAEYSTDAGLYLSLPFSEKCALGTKMLIGKSEMKGLEIRARKRGMTKNFDPVKKPAPYDVTWDYFSIKGNKTVCFATGLSFSVAYKSSFCWRTFIDWRVSNKKFTAKLDPLKWKKYEFPDQYKDQDFAVEGVINKTLTNVSAGFALSVIF